MFRQLAFLLLLPIVVFGVAFLIFRLTSDIRLYRSHRLALGVPEAVNPLRLVGDVILMTVMGTAVAFVGGMLFGIVGVAFLSLAQYPRHLNPVLAYQIVGLPVAIVGMAVSFVVSVILAVRRWERSAFGQEWEEEEFDGTREEEQPKPRRAA